MPFAVENDLFIEPRHIADNLGSISLALSGGAMGQINPFTSSIAGVPLAQHNVTAEKERLRKAEELRKSITLREDEYENQVENTEEIEPVAQHEEPKNGKKSSHSHKHQEKDEEDIDNSGGLDTTA